MLKITLYALASTILVVRSYPQTQGSHAPVELVKENSEVNIDGYSFQYETSDGSSRQEQGSYKNDSEQIGLVVKGSYQYVAPDGEHISVSYLADKNGFQPTENTSNANGNSNGKGNSSPNGNTNSSSSGNANGSTNNSPSNANGNTTSNANNTSG